MHGEARFPRIPYFKSIFPRPESGGGPSLRLLTPLLLLLTARAGRLAHTPSNPSEARAVWLGGSGRAFKAFWAAMGGGDKRPKRPQRLSNRWDDFVAEWDEGEEEPLSPSPPPKGSPKAAGQQEQPGSPAAGGRAGSRKRKRSSDSPSADADLTSS